jgi:hypothetical protein
MLASITLYIQLATETSPGELKPTPLSPVLDVGVIVPVTWKKCMEFFHT